MCWDQRALNGCTARGEVLGALSVKREPSGRDRGFGGK